MKTKSNMKVVNYKFGDMVYVGLCKGVVIGVIKKTKWTYYEIVFEDYSKVYDDNFGIGALIETYREDKL